MHIDTDTYPIHCPCLSCLFHIRMYLLCITCHIFLLSLAAAVGAVIFYGSSVSVAQVQAKGMPGIRIRCYYYCYYIILHQLDSAIHCCVYKAHKKVPENQRVSFIICCRSC